MKTISLVPDASRLMSSIRHIGYSFETAIADLLDNSIAANATIINIDFWNQPAPYLYILDNGVGMSYDELIQAMRYGSFHPDAMRSENDLGRYGLGLKTASLSQCKKLLVATKKDGVISCCRWDLQSICENLSSDWPLQVLSPEEVSDVEGFSELTAMDHGTLVHWSAIDFGGGKNKADFEEQMENAKNHIALVFHRFLRGEDGLKKIQVFVNKSPTEPRDPFLQHTPGKHGALCKAQQTLTVDGNRLAIAAYLLPYDSEMTMAQRQALGTKKGLRRTQGFYIYRSKRLLTQGGWFGIKAQGEFFKFARVKVDLSNDSDEEWSLDVKKSIAIPPKSIRDLLFNYISSVVQQSSDVSRTHAIGRKAQLSDDQLLWNALENEEGAIINVRINRDFPAIKNLVEKHPSLSSIFDLLEKTIPVDAIYHTRAADRLLENQAPIAPEKALEALQALLTTVPEGLPRTQLFRQLINCDPFSFHAKYIKDHFEDKHHDE